MLSFFGIVPEGHILDIPNGVLGMLFYSFIFIRFSIGKQPRGVLFTPLVNYMLSSFALASSIFLARVLYINKDLCLVCITTHIINTTLWVRGTMEVWGTRQKDKMQ